MSAPLVKTATPGVYKRGRRYVVAFRDSEGRQRRQSARTLVAARQLKAQLAADVSRGEYRPQSRLTFREYATAWVDDYAGRTAHGLRETTREEYRRNIERRAIPHFGNRRLTEIGPRDVKAYVTAVAATGVSRNTVRLALAPVRALFATAVEDELIRTNPAAGVRLPAQDGAAQLAEQEQVKALTEPQLAALLEATPL
jgi:integrase